LTKYAFAGSDRVGASRVGWIVAIALALLFVSSCTPSVSGPASGQDTLSGNAETGVTSAEAVTSPSPEPTPSEFAKPANSTREVATPEVFKSDASEASAVESGSVAATGESEEPLAIPAGGSASSTAVAAPSATPSTDADTAKVSAPRLRVVALDPGHGGPESGASAEGLVEKDINLEIALKLADLLREQGYEVVLTRDTDRAVSPEYKGGSYASGLGNDLQARVDIANGASADVFLSIHNNGSADSSQAGTEVWYNKQRSFADRNLALAKLVLEGLLKRIRALGYPAIDRGIKDDSNFRVFRGRAYNIFVLGSGEGPRAHSPTQMPGVLGESLFVSNPGDAAMLRQERTLDAIAAGYRDAIVSFFEQGAE